ncbi:MAG: NADH:flavin oxidoreductase [Deltaproteobacteria bacterium]|nr:NADH:flavin oxidoreductase [Deltaproteobacteria bacterium]
MSLNESILFTPLAIGTVSITGRIIKTATSETRATADGFATQQHTDFYLPMAKGGVPLIITGNLYTGLDGKSTPLQMGVDDDNKIPALKQLVDSMHVHGTRIFAQLNHAGRQVIPGFAGIPEAVSASGVKDLSTGTRPRALTAGEIQRIVQQFADAAARCKQAGFDGVQIHAGHGYLVNQFLTPYTNRRNDDYGGSFKNRLRFLRDLYRAMRARVGKDYPVIIKFNGSDYLPLRPGLKTPELVEIAKAMEQEGIDAVEVSVGQYESGFPMVRGTFARCLREMRSGGVRHLAPWRRVAFNLFWPIMALLFNLLFKGREGFNLHYARQFKQALSIPVICVGGFLSRKAMQAAIEQGLCDAVSAGRGFIADPLLYRHFYDGTSGPRCVDCNACVGLIGTQPVDCYHPGIRAEKDAMLAAMKKENVAGQQFS